MLIRAIGVQGFSGLPAFRAEIPGRMVSVGGHARAAGALFDALTLAFGAFSEADALRSWRRLGFTEPEISGAPIPDSVVLPQPALARALVDPEGDRTLKVELEIELDPPQFRLVRQHAMRDPELGQALGEHAARLKITLGWAFTADFEVASCGVLAMRLGEIAPRPGEPCPWRDELLRSLAGRGQVRGPLELEVEEFALADRSPDLARRRALRLAREALAAPPLGVGELSVVEVDHGDRWLAVGEELVPLRVLGPEAIESVSMVQWVFIDTAEILALRVGPRDPALSAWLAAQVEAAASPLEQIFVFGGEGPHDVVVAPLPRVVQPGLTMRR